MAESPKISIITCFLDVAPYLEETIQSVLRQEYENWELVLIDDGATDGSTAIALNYEAQYPGKILYLEHEGHQNRGASLSRNLGIAKSTGQLIAFLDADDVWQPRTLSQLVSLMQQHEVSLVCEATVYWYEWHNTGKANFVVPVGTAQDKVYQPPQLMERLYPLGSGAAPCICGMLVTREAVEKYGGFDDSFEGMYDDQALLVKLYLHERVYVSSTCTNWYRQRPGSLVHSSHTSGKYAQERKRFLGWLEAYLKAEQIHEPAIRGLLRKALFPYRHPLLYLLSHTSPKEALKSAKKLLPQKIRRFLKNRFSTKTTVPWPK
ncbi:glycosyltransferase family 2 protein [Pontibacter akesuensis]|uniref:Glycosyltransferase involved in cell wall bisynthesis n=1 Tax=Pontibacter akesuensis TaxID=388950 RepID=A0A1I7GI56_9BACT|nr:glycosyltransferase family 2 protein [Pontibacter akesuensis]GHA56670.1 hypothetical protein GCM10007389_05380 [Pontibacter akesuensis]SFU48147.1 Glycosyltransferase involved in cell wall bisynthesis [Pontibacter akesuensis]